MRELNFTPDMKDILEYLIEPIFDLPEIKDSNNNNSRYLYTPINDKPNNFPNKINKNIDINMLQKPNIINVSLFLQQLFSLRRISFSVACGRSGLFHMLHIWH